MVEFKAHNYYSKKRNVHKYDLKYTTTLLINHLAFMLLFAMVFFLLLVSVTHIGETFLVQAFDFRYFSHIFQNVAS